MRPLPTALRRAFLATSLWMLASLVPGAAAAAPETALRAAPVIKVVVAVLPFRVHSARALDYLESSLADLLVTRLESSGRVRVVESLTVRESLVARGDERTEDALRRLAQELGADYVVAGSLTELAGSYSLDVRVTPIASRFASRSLVFTAAGDDELLDRVNELADRILEMVGSGGQRTRVAEVRIEGEVAVDEALREELRLRPGAIYESAAAERDVRRLRELPGVGAARVEVAREQAGIVVTYRLTPSEKLLQAALPSAERGERVAEVRIRGQRRIEANAIRARIATQAGDPYDPARVAADVREIHGLGFFRDIRVLSEAGEGGRILVFEVQENPVVREVSIVGNDSIDPEKIRDNLTLTTGSTLDFPLLFENSERVAALYRNEGFYLVEVGYEIQELPGEAVAVDFVVEEGEKLRLTEISFEGNQHFEDEELIKALKTRTWRWYSVVTRFLDRSGTYSEPVFLQDLQAVNDKYLNAGFLQVEINEPEVQASPEGLTVRVGLREGPRFSVGKVQVTGDATVDLAALQEELQLEEGEIFNRSHLTGDVETLEGRYKNRGFFYASVNPLTDVDVDALSVDVTFEVEKGPLLFVREIDISGNTTTIDPVVRREMQLVEGQLYSERSVALSRSRIRSLGFFEEVEFEPQQTDYPDQLDVDVKLVERPTGSLSFGAGFSSQDKFVLTGSLSQSNLFGRGYAASLSADIGGRSDRFFFSFTDPYFLGTDFSFTSQIFQTDVEFEDFEQEQSGIELTLGHALDEANQSRGFLRYSYSNREIEDDSGVNAAAVIFRELISGEESTSLLGLAFRSDTRNDRIVPTRGSVLGASVEYAGLGGFAEFARLEGRGTWFFQVPEWFPRWVPFREKSTFSLAARMGWAFPFNDISDFDFDLSLPNTSSDSEARALDGIDDDIELPLSERYFLGGLGTFQLRGFKARSVGPRRPILRRTGILGTGDLFTPVGREVQVPVTQPDGTLFYPTICKDTDDASFNFQGDKDGKCNSFGDEEDSDFDDLDETDVIGGSKFLSLSAEYRFPLSETLGLMGIVFLDVGNAFDENQNLWDVGLWRYGTGLGVLWFSPFGPLQAFVGMPLDKLEVEDATVFEFSVGGAGL